MYDILIRGGTIVDGSGAPAYKGDLGIKDGFISFIGMLQDESAPEVINAEGLVVAPGFIDIHSHDDLFVLENKTMDAKIKQGVTTTVTGNCGFSLFPVTPGNKQLFYDYVTGLFGLPEKDSGYAGLDDFYEELKLRGSGLNVAALVAHGVIRIAVMGFDQSKPSTSQLAEMKRLLRDALRSGAVGMSMGLIYPPGAYADTEELIELSKVVSEEGGIITSHIRSESQFLLEAVEEMLTIARVANVPLEISHLKACGIPNFGKGKEALKLISDAKNNGVDVTFDQYPYPAGSTTATTLLPPWVLEGGVDIMLQRLRNHEVRSEIRLQVLNGIPGSPWETMWRLIGWDKIVICSVQTDENKKYEGRNVQDISDELKVEPVDAFLNLLDQEEGRIILVMFQQDHHDLETIMTHHLQMFGTDGLPIKGKKSHPRLYGTYARVLGTYVREKQLLTLEQAINKMTYLPAHRLGMYDRGLLRPGMAADITLFDKDTIDDLATYENPAVHPSGIDTVIVNGHIVLKDGTFTGLYPGKPLLKKE